MTVKQYSNLELSRFREVQALAYRCAMDVADGLQPGVTERAAAQSLGDLLRREGVDGFFHRPFAWFGDRTCFKGFRTPLDFFPGDRKLERGMAAILDVAPVRDGYGADIGYSFSCGPNPELDRLHAELRGFRDLIAEMVSRRETLAEVYRGVEDLLADLGLRNCHRHYPFGVLAHRIFTVPNVSVLTTPVAGFGLGASASLLAQMVVSRLPASIAKRMPKVLRQGTPFCNTGPGSDEPPEPGLWAFEPHIARGDIGAKWEEILVVEDRKAWWLDDDLPHVHRWQASNEPPRAAGAGR
jgi:Xaa-Pro aminopeptidase